MPRRSRLLPVLIALFALALVLPGLRGPGSPSSAVHAAFGRGPTVVLVHGLGSRSGHWLPVARLLARRHRVVLVDLPGHGASPMPAPFSLERAAQALDRALTAAVDQPVILVGHSVGGLVVAAEALAHPGRVRGLVLVEAALRPQFEGEARASMLEALERRYHELLRAAYVSFGRDSSQGEALYREVAAMDSTIVKPWIRLALAADLSSRVAGLGLPVLAVLAERSWPYGEPWEETAAALGYGAIPRIEPRRLDGCGHFVMLDRADDLARAITLFAAHPEGEPIASRLVSPVGH